MMPAPSHHTPPPPDVAVLAGLFPELEIGKPLGIGGMGFVFEARQKSLGRRVALKLISAVTASPAQREQVEREAQALARLNHPYIVPLFDVGERGGWYYMLMELIEGEDLARRLARGPMPPVEALEVGTKVCDALTHAHASGVVHRDIKPSNILLGGQGGVKLVDFGLAKLLQRDPTDTTEDKSAVGTPDYMPPEQRRAAWAVDERADLYALGVVLYEMLTGSLPEGHFQLPSRIAGTSTQLDEAVMQAMALEPGARFQSAGAMREALVSADAVHKATKKGGGIPVFLALALIGLALGALLACFIILKPVEKPALQSLRRETAAKTKASGGSDTSKIPASPVNQQSEVLAAVERGDLPTLTRLIQNRAEPDVVGKDGWTPFLLAVARDRVDIIGTLHLAGARHDAMLPGRATAMHIAAGKGSLNAAAWLKDRGTVLDARDDAGFSPMDWAAACLQPGMVRWLVVQGQPIGPQKEGAAEDRGLGPLHLAAAAGKELFSILPEKAFWKVVWQDSDNRASRCLETLRTLLDLGADTKRLDLSNLTPIHYAAAANQAEAISLLVEKGADANSIPMPQAFTPLAAAAGSNATAAIKSLIAHGAVVRMPVEMESPLHIASRQGHADAVRLLLEQGADPNARDLQLLTPLHRAAGFGHAEIVMTLVRKGANLSARDISRSTALHHAASAGQLEAVKLLCEAGAELTARDGQGLKPSDRAQLGGHGSVVALLEGLSIRKQKAGEK